MRTFLIIFMFGILAGTFASCKKCLTCTAHDSVTNEVKFRQKSCSKGPLLDDWKADVKNSYPAPQYDTKCE